MLPGALVWYRKCICCTSFVCCSESSIASFSRMHSPSKYLSWIKGIRLHLRRAWEKRAHRDERILRDQLNVAGDPVDITSEAYKAV
jgi:hypothetical protein